MKISKLFAILFTGTILVSCSSSMHSASGFGSVYSNADDCNCGSSNKNSSKLMKEFDVKPFNGISASSRIKIHYTQADTRSVFIETDEETMKRLEVKTVSGRLTLRLKQCKVGMLWIHCINDNSNDIVAYISAPELNEVDLSGHASLNAPEFSNTSNFNFSGSGVSGLNIDKMTLNNAMFNCSGGSSVISQVIKAGNAKFNMSGGAHSNVEQINAPELNFNISGGSWAEIKLNSDNVNINASGGATFKAQGKTTAININCSGGSNANLKGLSYSNSSFSSSGGGSITK